MTVEEMRTDSENLALAGDESKTVATRNAMKMSSWILIAAAEICERLDKLIEQGEKGDD